MNSPLIFTLKNQPLQKIDVSPLIPDTLQGMSIGEVKNQTLQVGNREEMVSSIFDVTGSNTQFIRFEKPEGKLDFVGKGMRKGLIEVNGNAGSYLGQDLGGGKIMVRGSVQAYAAVGQRAGTITVQGDAGDFLGGALPGDNKGMRGGIVQVMGNAGDRIGDNMRRGFILIQGNVGNYLGSRMIAGTIITMGRVGRHPGYGMRRGSILIGEALEKIPPTFMDCGSHALGFINLLFKGLKQEEAELVENIFDISRFKRVQRYSGDSAVMGKGEILVALK